MHRGWGRIQRLGVAALLILSATAAWLQATAGAESRILPGGGPAWISPPGPPTAALHQWGHADPPIASFLRSFDVGERPAAAELEIRSLGRISVDVNGEPLPGGASEAVHRRDPLRIDVTAALRPGVNELRVRVTDLRGPPLLSLRLEGLPAPIESDPSWQVRIDGAPVGRAVIADDTRRNPVSLAVETPAEALRRRGPAVVGLALAGAVLLWLALRAGESGRGGAVPGLVLAAVALAWSALYATKFAGMPLVLGFDVLHHRAYVDFLRDHHALPLATDGWSTYHPPLFYAVAALLATIAERAPQVLPWLSGVGHVFVAHALATRVFPGDTRSALLALLFAAALPMNLYTSAYFSNEAPHALLVGLALLATVDALRAPRATPLQLALVGGAFALAALTKFTALALVPVAGFFLLVKLVAVERAPAARAVARLALPTAVFVLGAGWFYARNVAHFGRALVGNWSLPGPERIWWQEPGFHTLAYYTGFGESLVHPYLAGFHSFWDGLYSTLWGDGGIGGRMLPSGRHEFWSYDFMSAGYWLAVPISVLLVVGALRLLREALTDLDPSRRAVLSFLLTSIYAIGFSVLYLTLTLPYFAQAKAFYGLCVLAPLACCFAAGAGALDRWLERTGRTPWRLAFAGMLGAAFGTFFLAFAA